jgi:hypothetical protein
MFRQQQQGNQFPTMNPAYANTRIQPPNASQPTYSSPLDQVKQYTAKFEDILENLMDPIKPYTTPLLEHVLMTWQTFTRVWSLFDRGHIPRRCIADRNTVWRPNPLPHYIPSIPPLGNRTHLPHH